MEITVVLLEHEKFNDHIELFVLLYHNHIKKLDSVLIKLSLMK